MSKNKYWQDRFIEEEERLNKTAGDEFRRQQLEYERAIARMNKDIEVWYNRIAKNNDVSLAEAKKMLNDKELKEFKWTLDEYIKYGEENGIKKDWSRQLENASVRVHIERLEAMKLQVRGEIEKLYNGRESGFESYLKNLYKDQYNRTAFQIAKGTGVGTNIYSLNDKLVNTVIKKPWAPDGKNFSDRIWENKDKLINNLHTEMTQAFIRGDSLEKLADKIAEKMKVSKANASRLVYTESAAYSSRARLKSYQDLGVEKYEIVATLDNRTSDICQDMDGKVFDLKDYEVGVTANPFHVRCRTTTAPYFDDMQGERAARNETTGETEYVPADMKYSEWKEKYVSNNSEKVLQKSDKEGIITIQENNPRDVKMINLETQEIKVEKGDFKDWIFDWYKQSRKSDVIRALKVKNTSEVIGLIGFTNEESNKAIYVDLIEASPANNPKNKIFKGKKEYYGIGGRLLVEAIKESYEKGYGGFIYFDAKTELIEYYKKEFGARLIGSQRMAIFEKEAEVLYEKYNGKR